MSRSFFGQKVRVHYNLHNCPPPGSGRTMKPGAPCFAVKVNQGGKWSVADTVQSILLEDVTFRVSESGVDRIRRTGNREVIAWFEGTAVNPDDPAVKRRTGTFSSWDGISFNPKGPSPSCYHFYFVDTRKPARSAQFVYCNGTRAVAKGAKANPDRDRLTVAGEADLKLLAEVLGGEIAY